jgi:hypothetical protein
MDLLTGIAAAFKRVARAPTSGSGTHAKVFFSLSLAGKDNQVVWEKRCSSLGHTLRSILNQTDSRFRIIIVGHEYPEIAEMNDRRIKFISCSFDKPKDRAGSFLDKRRKRIISGRYIARKGGGYVVWMDADDLVSKNLVRYMRRKTDPNGYIFQNGYLLDFPSMIIAPIPGAWKKTFDQCCGSCAAIYFSREDIGESYSEAIASYYGRFVQHAKWQQVADNEGRPLHPVPFPAVIYVLNTAHNLSAMPTTGREYIQKINQEIIDNSIPLSPKIAKEFSIFPVRDRVLRMLLISRGIPGHEMAMYLLRKQ